MKRKLALTVMILLLAGCNVLPPPAPPPQLHDFGTAQGHGPGPALPLAVEAVEAPSWLSGSAILYRNLQDSPTRLRRYAQNQWAAPPAELLQAGLEARLAARNSSAAHVDPRYALRVVLLRFEQVLDGGEGEARIEAEAQVWERDTHRLIARHLFTESRSVSADIGGALNGMGEVARQAQAAILDWSVSVLPTGGEETTP